MVTVSIYDSDRDDRAPSPARVSRSGGGRVRQRAEPAASTTPKPAGSTPRSRTTTRPAGSAARARHGTPSGTGSTTTAWSRAPS